MNLKKTVAVAAERSAIALINAASISQPTYEPLELPKYEKPIVHDGSDIQLFGKLLIGSGAVVSAAGAALELLPDSADNLAGVTVISGLGAAAIGGLITAYEKLG